MLWISFHYFPLVDLAPAVKPLELGDWIELEMDLQAWRSQVLRIKQTFEESGDVSIDRLR